MITITNGQAAKLLSPVLDEMFGDNNRKFPAAAGFKLNRAVEKIRGELNGYREAYQAVIQKHDGTVNQESGQVSYASPEKMLEAAAEINDLNLVELEVNVEKVDVNDLPDMSLAEMNALEPILHEEVTDTPDTPVPAE